MWNSSLSKCINRCLESQTCSYSSQCFSPMICSSLGICQCTQNFTYFDSSTQSCIAQGTYANPCNIDYNCRVDKYLGCTAGQCQCISSFPLWSTGYSKCIVPRSYTENCTATSDCASYLSLVCSNGTSCYCPSTLLYNKCDCPVRLVGNETYWNGAYCVQALSYNQPCSTNYSCQTLTQGTTCSGGICSCSPSQFFNTTSDKCETLVSINGTCSQANSCDASKGLSCQANNLCQCSSVQFWSINVCVNQFNYTQGTCSANDQCLYSLGLICKLSGSGCSCPMSLSNSKCDCPPVTNGIEYYWSGTNCSQTKSVNQTCSSSLECQSAQNTVCSGGICTCNSNCVWNSTGCVCCAGGWTYNRGSCFNTGSCGGGSCASFCSGANCGACSTGCSDCNSGCNCCPTFNYMNSSNFCQSMYPTYPTVRLAILQNSDALYTSFVTSFATDLWFDAQRGLQGSSTTTYNSVYTPGYSIDYNSAFWDDSGNGRCATFYELSGSTIVFQFQKCSSVYKRVLCEYILL